MVETSCSVGFQTTRIFGPCLRFHAGRLSGEKAGIPDGFWLSKGPLEFALMYIS
jgi:hypothetical protein